MSKISAEFGANHSFFDDRRSRNATASGLVKKLASPFSNLFKLTP
jgi:hypothetical protein